MKKVAAALCLSLALSLTMMSVVPVMARTDVITVMVKDINGNPMPGVAVYITQNPIGSIWPGIGGQSPVQITNAEGKVYIPIDLTDPQAPNPFPGPFHTTSWNAWVVGLPIVGVYVYDNVSPIKHYNVYPLNWKLNNPAVRTIPITFSVSD